MVGAIAGDRRALVPKRLDVRPAIQLLRTFGLRDIQGCSRNIREAGMPTPSETAVGPLHLGFMFMPVYRRLGDSRLGRVCFATWLSSKNTKLRPPICARRPKIRPWCALSASMCPRMVTLNMLRRALAASPACSQRDNQVRPAGASESSLVFGGRGDWRQGSIIGSIVTGFVLGFVEGCTKVFYPEASNTVCRHHRPIVLLIRPTGCWAGGMLWKPRRFQ